MVLSSTLNGLLREGKIHLAPASSIGYALAPEKFVLAPDLCTSCRLEVRSVKLFSHYPFEQLSSRRVHLTSQSATSAALVRILANQRYGVRPIFVSEGPCNASFDARLLIGDEALLEGQAQRFEFSYDPDSALAGLEGLPFVFWSLEHPSLGFNIDLRPKVESFLRDVTLSVKHFQSARKSSLDIWLSHYPVTLPRDIMENYYEVLDYSFTEERKKSLSLFFSLCYNMGLIPQNPQLVFL
jgi:chorismate dehydratase